MKLFKKHMFCMLLIIGTLITISSSNWFSAWMGLEVNLLAFIPMIFDQNYSSNESTLKYFLIQIMGSLIFIFFTLMLSMKTFLSQISLNINMLLFIMSSALFLKMGAAPFHFWLPNIIEGLSWPNSILILTWQKLAPLSLIFLMLKNIPYMSYFNIWLSLLLGAIGGFNQTSLKKILAYSSIAQLGWILLTLHISNNLFILYMTMYFMLMFNSMFTFWQMNIYTLNQTFVMKSMTMLTMLLIMMNLLSLGGLPPLMGFFPKWMVLAMTINISMITLLILILSSLITLFYYLRLTYQSLLIFSPQYKMSWIPQIHLMVNFLSFITMTFFVFIPLFF